MATNLALLKKYYQLAIVHIANANSMLRNWKNKIELLIKNNQTFFSLKWKLTACWDEKTLRKKSYTKIFVKTHYLRSKWVHFSAKKLVRKLIFEKKLSYYLVAVFGKVETIWSIGKNHCTQYECETHVEELGKKIKLWNFYIFFFERHILTERLPNRQPNHYHAKSSFQTLVGSCMTTTHP